MPFTKIFEDSRILSDNAINKEENFLYFRNAPALYLEFLVHKWTFVMVTFVDSADLFSSEEQNIFCGMERYIFAE